MNGYLLIDKPRGVSSAGVIRKIKQKLGPVKIGHGGTLDPMATGLLIVALGRATKLLRFSMGADKEYRAEICLGTATDTDDAEGRDISHAPWEHIARGGVLEAMGKFCGEISQVPPKYSALHVNGKRAYDLARTGKDFELAQRAVRVDEFELLDLSLPLLRVRVACSGGTYIRSLARDLAQELGTVGHLSALRRTRSGQMKVESAVELSDFLDSEARNHVQDPSEVLSGFAALSLCQADIVRLGHGQHFALPALEPGNYRLCAQDTGELVAVLCVDAARKMDIIRM